MHLCLTSEWDISKWRPVTKRRALWTQMATFSRWSGRRKDLPPITSLKEADPKTEEVERELRRQIEVARRHIPHISYLSSHMGFPSLNPALARRCCSALPTTPAFR